MFGITASELQALPGDTLARSDVASLTRRRNRGQGLKGMNWQEAGVDMMEVPVFRRDGAPV